MKLNYFKEEKNCCGCTACKHICPQSAIEMKYNKKGFLVPVIDKEKCINCGLCQNVCAFYQKGNNITKDSIFLGVKRKGFQKRMSSQSGGAFSVLAEEILDNSGCVYGVKSEGKNVFYTRVVKKKELKQLKGSKYVQADMCDVLKNVEEDLKCKRKILFSGTACHIDGLISYLNRRKIEMTNLLTCDLICHGVPSSLVYRDYYQHIEEKYGRISRFSFRNKIISGWHGHTISFCVNKKKMYSSNNYVDIFYSHLALRQSCFICPYASFDRISDITIGDFWGIEKNYSEFDDNLGCSLMILNTSKGLELFNAIKNKVNFFEVNMDECMQPNLQYPTGKPEKYDEFWEKYEREGFYETVKEFCGFSEKKDRIIYKYQFLKNKIYCFYSYLLKK